MNNRIITNFFILLVFTCLCFSAEPMIYLPFNGTYINSCSVATGLNGNPITSPAGYSPLLSNEGISNGCLDLREAVSPESGVVQYNDSELNASLDGLKSFTVAWWVKPDLGETMTGVYFNVGNGDVLQAYANSSGAPRFRVNQTWLGVPTSAANPDPEGWTFYAYTYNSEVSQGEVVTHLYVGKYDEQSENYVLNEDTLDSRKTTNAGPTSLDAYLLIGSRSPTGHNWGTDGMIDEFRLYGSETDGSGALSFSEIEVIVEADIEQPDTSEPIVYLPFDEDWKTQGQVSGVEASVVTAGGSTPEFGPGVSNKCYDIRTATDNYVPTGCLYYEGGVETALDELKSLTISFWANPDGILTDGYPLSEAHILDRSPGGDMEVFFNAYGRPRFRMHGSVWLGVATTSDSTAETEDWTYYAITYDSTVASGETTTRLYVGKDTGSGYTLIEAPLHSNYSSNNPGPSRIAGALIVGNRYVNGDQGMAGMLDELQIFGSKTDESGALSASEIGAVMMEDLEKPDICGDWWHQPPVGDVNKDCLVDMQDISIVSGNWLRNNNP